MSRHVYFERKYDAENTRRMIEEATGQKAALKRTAKGWYCDIDKAYLTKDGASVGKGSIVYTANGVYEVADCDMSGEYAAVRIRPCETEPDKDKDVRDGILWYCGSDTQNIMEMIESRHRFSNEVDGRSCINPSRDYIYIECRQTCYKVKTMMRGFQLSPCEDQYEKLTVLQGIEIVGDELRPINNIAERQKSFPLSEFYARPLTKMERICAKTKLLLADFDDSFIVVIALIMITGIIAMIGCIVEYVS